LMWGADGTMYVGLDRGASPSSVAHSHDGGVSWTFLELQGESVWSLLPDPNQADVIYVSLGTGGLFRSQGGGDSWIPIGDGLPMSEVDAMAISPMGALYAGGFAAPVGVYVSHDQGETWFPLQGSPEVPVLFLDWADDRLLVGTGEGLWQWTTDGQWACLFDKPIPIYSAVSADGVLFASGEDGIYELREGTDPHRISPAETNNIDVIPGDVPRFVASAIDGSVLQWRLDDMQVKVIARGVDLDGAIYVGVVRAQSDDPAKLWAGTEHGLFRGEERRWFEARSH
jgi:hypothetical protein